MFLGLPELDMMAVQEFCPVDSDAERDYQPQTYAQSSFLDYVPLSRIRPPLSQTLSASRSLNDRVNFYSDDLLGSGGTAPPGKSPVNLISFDDSQDELPLNSDDTSPTSPVNVLIG